VPKRKPSFPYYNNFFHNYRLGPEDVISVTVFQQEKYSRPQIKVPPSGRIYLALIPEGVFVNGKTPDEVAEIIKKRYDEYIIDSAGHGFIGPGRIVSLQRRRRRWGPGIKLMTRPPVSQRSSRGSRRRAGDRQPQQDLCAAQATGRNVEANRRESHRGL
jgi:hypothetical protein